MAGRGLEFRSAAHCPTGSGTVPEYATNVRSTFACEGNSTTTSLPAEDANAARTYNSLCNRPESRWPTRFHPEDTDVGVTPVLFDTNNNNPSPAQHRTRHLHPRRTHIPRIRRPIPESNLRITGSATVTDRVTDP